MPVFNVQAPGTLATALPMVGTVATIPIETGSGTVSVYARVRDAVVVPDLVDTVELSLYVSDEWEATLAMLQCKLEGYAVFAETRPRCAGGRHEGCSETISEVTIPHSTEVVHICSAMIEAGVLPFHRVAAITGCMCDSYEALADWERWCPPAWVKVIERTLDYFRRPSEQFLIEALKGLESHFAHHHGDGSVLEARRPFDDR